MTVTMADIAGDVAVDPDAQAAVTDFLDYTEYLPADLIRSLTLIRGLDDIYLSNANTVHDLTKVYGSLPSIPASNRPDTQRLRSQISSHLDQALNARESAHAEACRLFDLTDRHQDRLKSIIAKLKALPKPPSRDPTPQPPSSAQVKRSRSGRKLENGTSTQRLTLKAPKGPIAAAILHRPKHRRITVPGEVLPPYDPDEPIASTEVSDWESEPPSPIRPVLKFKQPKPPKPSASIEVVEKKPREPRETATYRKPTPPPEDALIGSKYRPWTHLTEYEMYRLRKKMKKNHTWEPSDVMIRRELADKGRGWENYYKEKATAQANGQPFIDIENSEKPQSPPAAKTEAPKPSQATPVPVAAASKTKTVKKPDSKKDKREDTPRDKAAIAAQEAELAARRLGDIGSAFRNLFSPFSSALASLNRSSSTPTANGSTNAGKKPNAEKGQKKRKLEDVASTSPSVEPETQKKKQKTIHKPSPLPSTESKSQSAPAIAPTAPATTAKIPPLKITLKPQTSTASAVSTPLSSSGPVSTQSPSSAPTQSEGSSSTSTRSSSRRSTAAPVESVSLSSTRPSRRSSMTPAAQTRKTPALETTPKTAMTAASRRSKREAPGTVTQSSQDGGAAVSVSQRKSKPHKATKSQTPKVVADIPQPQIRVDADGREEIIDPDEERYCICGDVSWGEMICCELDEKVNLQAHTIKFDTNKLQCEFGVWFHMECVGLIELPPRTVKWYCPGDRKKHHKGEQSNGLVGRGIK